MQKLLETQFENAWCSARTNPGNIAPWMTPPDEGEGSKGEESEAEPPRTLYETIWREIVDLLPFIKEQSTAQEDEPQEPRLNSQEPSQREAAS